ncbi:hypothetical protein UP10_33980 [Bradyrhizobium sp. LTSPM299]|nr:hypothetical protein UP10_33980 [Bradyrhizobium sp. LTSPM299]
MFKNKKRRTTMRLLILASAASLVVTGAAMATESVRTPHHVTHHYHHHLDTNAPAAEGAFPADVLSAHDSHLENLRESGYNPSKDYDATGNMKAN